MALAGALTRPWVEAGTPSSVASRASAAPRALQSAALKLPAGAAPFWARVCALTAFVLELEPAATASWGAASALIGREIVKDAAGEDPAHAPDRGYDGGRVPER